jgi:hypothetical protein
MIGNTKEEIIITIIQKGKINGKVDATGPPLIKSKAMKSTGAIQVVAVLLLIASAASCEVAKEYSTRVFKPTIPQKRADSTATALKFMQFDSENASDSIDLKDFANKEVKEIDKPEVVKDMTKMDALKDSTKTDVAIVESKPVQKEQPIDASKRGTTRTRRVRQ